MAVTIESTTNYGQFKTIQGNRMINEGFLKRLVASIEKDNLLESHPIIVNKNFEVIDGQHRLKAAEKLHLPIHYFVARESGLDEVQLMNTTVRPWVSEDYLESYIQQGKQDYVKLKEFCEEFHLPIIVGVRLLLGKAKNTKSDYSIFKTGSFTVRDEGGARTVAEYMQALRPWFEPNTANHRPFLYAVESLVAQGVSLSKLISKLQRNGTLLNRQSTQKDYIRQFEDVLNKYARPEFQTRLY